jgi:hypothetical protein
VAIVRYGMGLVAARQTIITSGGKLVIVSVVI